jgi:LacI family transcriptional regulator
MFAFHHVVWSSRKRFEGFQRACMEAGIPAGNIHYAEFEGQTDVEIRDRVLGWLDAGVTGFFAFCDVEAWNVLSRMEESGGLEHRSIEIVGFDNIFRYISFMKPICSVDPNLAEEARLAVDLIRRRIHDPSLPPQQVMLPVTLVAKR